MPLRRNFRCCCQCLDTLFNKRDYRAAEKFWSPNYIQHNIEPGRDRLFNLVRPRCRHSNMSMD